MDEPKRTPPWGRHSTQDHRIKADTPTLFHYLALLGNFIAQKKIKRVLKQNKKGAKIGHFGTSKLSSKSTSKSTENDLKKHFKMKVPMEES